MKRTTKILSLLMVLTLAFALMPGFIAKAKLSGIRLTDKTYELTDGIITSGKPSSDAGAANEDASSESGTLDDAAESDSGSAEFTFGTVKGTVYENSYFGISLTLPDGYTFSQEGEIPKQDLDVGYTVTAVSANDKKGQNNVNIHMGNYGNPVAEKDYVDDGVKRLEKSFANTEYTLKSIDVVQREVAGENHYIVVDELSYKGTAIYQQCLVILKDGYNITITTTSIDKDNAQKLLDSVVKTN